MSQTGLTITEYARHRGCSQPYISRLVKQGRIQVVNGRIDPVAADAALEKSTDPDRKRGAAKRMAAQNGKSGKKQGGRTPPDNEPVVSATSTYTEMRAKRESVLAQSAELDYRQRVGQLCEVAAATRAIGECAAISRRAIEQIPNRVAARIAAALGVDVRAVEPLMRAEIERSLIELADMAQMLPERIASTSQ